MSKPEPFTLTPITTRVNYENLVAIAVYLEWEPSDLGDDGYEILMEAARLVKLVLPPITGGDHNA